MKNKKIPLSKEMKIVLLKWLQQGYVLENEMQELFPDVINKINVLNLGRGINPEKEQ
ncbi:hypothetical protein [Plebeiibacterium sediminum]|uniref:Uncharacterized protein n=1 Tax=Plebeiibacterium sediminum TaxID=2992112 RepID=A0AAE3M422_9BACT|nr:hypothetical protein [Plebeiobacterium sediminum]MCW3786832.1 hypothetical protein [Plebeiobacterium sediminum]